MFSLEKVINSKLNGLEYSVILDSGVTKLGGLVTSLNFATPFSPRKMRSVEYMSEVFICRGGSGSGSGKPYPGAEKVLQTYLITADQDWVVPNNIINNELFVRIAGGGGGYDSGNYGGGGGGWMNNDTIKVGAGSIVPIKIGKGGGNCQDGGSTSFGTYLSASGGRTSSYGSGGSGGSGGYGYTYGGRGYQFGGGGARGSSYLYGGHGGTWGGGGAPSGDGGYYGGGGGGIKESDRSGIIDYMANGGNSNMYGGGGGGYRNGGKSGDYHSNGILNQKGFGGNGGSFINKIIPENGTNTIGWTNVLKDNNGNYVTGAGKHGTTAHYKYKQNTIYDDNLCCGGGGGFGGNGGNGAYGSIGSGVAECVAGGGGGGYGSNGGAASIYNAYSSYDRGNTAGGGGGYGNGADGGGNQFMYYGTNSYDGYSFSGGGGGYFAVGRIGGGGYYSGGSYGGGGVYLFNNSFGDGGARYSDYSYHVNKNGRDGGCLIQFYQWL